MVQEQDTGLTPEEQEHINQATIRLMKMLDITPAPTELGNALRGLGDLVDYSPSILAARKNPDVPVMMHVFLTTAEAVEAVGEDLGLPVETEVSHTGQLHTRVVLFDDPAQLTIVSITKPPRELHRPVDVTETIEEQEQ